MVLSAAGTYQALSSLEGDLRFVLQGWSYPLRLTGRYAGPLVAGVSVDALFVAENVGDEPVTLGKLEFSLSTAIPRPVMAAHDFAGTELSPGQSSSVTLPLTPSTPGAAVSAIIDLPYARSSQNVGFIAQVVIPIAEGAPLSDAGAPRPAE
jgi:hypothetical protein